MSASRHITVFFAIGIALKAMANPTGMTVASGAATTQASGSQLTITTGNRAVLNWQSFNIGAGETTVFNQPSSHSLVVNNIHDANASQIYGTLQANGLVVLMNQNGFYFGPNSFVQTAGLVVSTANCLPPQNSGGSWEFNGPPPLSTIINYGQISVGKNGSVFLIADGVENHGMISAPDGSIGIASGQTVLLSERPDGRGMSMHVTLPGGSVDNYGTLIADAGTIALQAKVVNQGGLIQANSVRDQNGVIELLATDDLNLGANSKITANGDDSVSGSAGGAITLRSENNFSDNVGSKISVAGGSQGGNGGSVEISAPDMAAINSIVGGHATTGNFGGKLLLDPDYIVLDQSGNDNAGNGSVLVGDSSGNTLHLNVGKSDNGFSDSAFIGFSEIMLQAKYDITLADNTSWSLSDSTGQSSGQLVLEAGRNIIFGNTTSLFDVNNWSIALCAGVSDFTPPNQPNQAPTVKSGAGSIYLNANDPNNPNNSIFDPSGHIQTASGPVTLVAGQDITVGSGFVITTGGGSISAHALAGSIDTGSDAQGYHFDNSESSGSLGEAYNLQNDLGGISTAAGGDVTLIAGGDVTSFLPAAAGDVETLTGGSGAYGPQPGNVTVVAGGNVTGHYLVANGTGSIYAGAKMDANENPVVVKDVNNNPITEKDVNGNPVTDASGNPVYVYALDYSSTGSAGGTDSSTPSLALSLINGGWNVAAAQNIFLQEVRNPNGVFDTQAGAAFNHYFDYSLNDYVNLSAGNLVQLGAPPTALPRDNSDGRNIPFIYPSILNITAGDGGVTLVGGNDPYDQLILFPSPQGSLTINTSGSLVSQLPLLGSGNVPQIFNLIVSDSGSSQYKSSASFGKKETHAAEPVHLNDSTPLELNIGGDMDYIFLGVPEAAQITVDGNMNNCGFQGMNLSADPGFQVQIQEADGSTRMVTVDPEITRINVAGDIFNQGIFTSVHLPDAEAPDLSLLSLAITGSGDPAATTLATSFFYNPATKILTYKNIPGTTLANVLSLLNQLTVQAVDNNGVLQWDDPPFDTIPKINPVSVSVLGDPTVQGTIAFELAAQFHAAPSGTAGYTIGGGGEFDISARSIDLGTSSGIQSQGVGLYTVRSSFPLASLFGNGHTFDHGADVNVTTTGDHSMGVTATGDVVGDLDMFSSSIATLNGGNISINSGGDINAGSSVFSVPTLAVRGIYTTSRGDISVTATGDININGSRIVTYDGGNITVESLDGSVNAGTGASSVVQLKAYYEDPITQIVYFNNPGIPFSGIDALTFAARDALYPAPPAILGNILVEAPNGDINANVAGILQIPLNHLNYPDAITTVLAGYELRNSLGNPVTARDMAAGTPVLVSADRDITANGSGIIASNAKLKATGNINGLIFARNNIDISAQQNVNVTALGIGNVNVSSAGGTISGTIVGVGSVSVSGSSIDASLISANVNGATSGSSGLGQGTAANATSQSASSDDANKTADQSDDQDADDLKKKKNKGIALAQKMSRVTVLLSQKN
jgi:filamentous hemagglutinin family protein